jgi:magnesium chelatase subunit D
MQDALDSARVYKTARISTLLVDTSIRPDPGTRALCDALGARYVPLPAANSDALRGVVRAAQQGVFTDAGPAAARGVLRGAP